MRLADEREVFLTLRDRIADQKSNIPLSSGSRMWPGFHPLSPARKEVNYMLKLFVAIQCKLDDVRSEKGQTIAESASFSP